MGTVPGKPTTRKAMGPRVTLERVREVGKVASHPQDDRGARHGRSCEPCGLRSQRRRSLRPTGANSPGSCESPSGFRYASQRQGDAAPHRPGRRGRAEYSTKIAPSLVRAVAMTTVVLLLALSGCGSTSATATRPNGAQHFAKGCTTSQLSLRVGPKVSEPAEQRSRLLVLANTGSSTCSIIGYPKITLYGARGNALSFKYEYRGDQFVVTDARPVRVTLRPGATADVMINKTDCGTRSVDAAVSVTLVPPGDTGVLQAAIGAEPILSTCLPGDPASTVDISPVEATPSATRPSVSHHQ